MKYILMSCADDNHFRVKNAKFLKIILFPKGKHWFVLWVCNCVNFRFHKCISLLLIILIMPYNQGGFKSLGNFDLRLQNHFSSYFRNKYQRDVGMEFTLRS